MSSSVIEREVGGKREMTEGLAAQILHHIRTTELVPGTHVTAQDLALRFNVSRFPVGQALQLLAVKGVLTHERNRGYFVSDAETASAEALGLSNRDETSDVYFRSRRRSPPWPPARPGVGSPPQGTLRCHEIAACRRAEPNCARGVGRAPPGLRLVVFAHAQHA